MDGTKSSTRYDAVAATLHWLIAAMILFMFWLGPFMASLPETDPRQFPLFQLHKSVGLSILVLSIARLAWRLAHPAPPPPLQMKAWERRAARVTHRLLYALTIGVPLLGWATVSAASLDVPTMWFGLFEWPHISFLSHLPRVRKTILEPELLIAHVVFAFSMMGLVVLHVGAALNHHFIERDDVLKRMLPWLKITS
jgi:cytochrome b561